MVGVKDHRQESLIGQAGEIEPVYDAYAVGFFLFDPARRVIHLPQLPADDDGPSALRQEREGGYLPVIVTRYRTPLGVELEQRVLATAVGLRQRSVVLDRLVARAAGGAGGQAWLCLSITPAGPSGFQRHDRAGRYLADRRISFLRYVPAEQRVEVNTTAACSSRPPSPACCSWCSPSSTMAAWSPGTPTSARARAPVEAPAPRPAATCPASPIRSPRSASCSAGTARSRSTPS